MADSLASEAAAKEQGMRRHHPAAILLVVAALLCLSAIVSELASAAVFFAYYYRMHKPVPPDLRFHPLFHQRIASTESESPGFLPYDPVLGYRAQPTTDRYYTTILTVCSEGFIDNYGCTSQTPQLTRKPPGVKRVFILGGSTVAGYGASGNQATIAAYLERKLNAARPRERYEVINFGVGGYTSPQEFILLANDIIRYAPDLVIFYNGVNDVYYGTYLGGYVSHDAQTFAAMNFHKRYLDLTRAIGAQENDSIKNDWIKIWIKIDATPLFRKFYTTSLILRVRDRILGQIPVSTRAIEGRKIVNSPSRAAQLYLQNVENAIAVATYHKVPVAYFLQPTIWNKPVRAPTEGDRGEMRTPRGLEEAMLEFQKAVASAFARLETSFDSRMRRSVKVEALLDLFAAVPQKVFLDMFHTNDLGNELIAERLLHETWPLLHPRSASVL